MKDASGPEAAAKPQGKPMSLRRARAIVIAMTGFLLLVAAEGIHDIHVGKTYFALLNCFVAVMSLLSLSIYVNLYLQVKKGVPIVLGPLAFPALTGAPFLISLIALALMTLMVIVASLVTYYIGFIISRSLNVRLVIVAVNLFAWLITAFFWYRLTIEKRRVQKIEPVLVQAAGIWPPAPRSPAKDTEFLE